MTHCLLLLALLCTGTPAAGHATTAAAPSGFQELFYRGLALKEKAAARQDPGLYFKALMCFIGQQEDAISLKYDRSAGVYFVDETRLRLFPPDSSFIGHYTNIDEITGCVRGFDTAVRQLKGKKARKKAHAMWLWIRYFIGESFTYTAVSEKRISEPALRSLVAAGYEFGRWSLAHYPYYIITPIDNRDMEFLQKKERLIQEKFRALDLYEARRQAYYFEDLRKLALMSSYVKRVFTYAYTREADAFFNRRCSWILKLDDLEAIRERLDIVEDQTRRQQDVTGMISSLGRLENRESYSLNDLEILHKFRQNMFNPALSGLNDRFAALESRINRQLADRYLAASPDELYQFTSAPECIPGTELERIEEYAGRILNAGIRFALPATPAENEAVRAMLDRFLALVTGGAVTARTGWLPLVPAVKDKRHDSRTAAGYRITAERTGNRVTLQVDRPGTGRDR